MVGVQPIGGVTSGDRFAAFERAVSGRDGHAVVYEVAPPVAHAGRAVEAEEFPSRPKRGVGIARTKKVQITCALAGSSFSWGTPQPDVSSPREPVRRGSN